MNLFHNFASILFFFKICINSIKMFKNYCLAKFKLKQKIIIIKVRLYILYHISSVLQSIHFHLF